MTTPAAKPPAAGAQIPPEAPPVITVAPEEKKPVVESNPSAVSGAAGVVVREVAGLKERMNKIDGADDEEKKPAAAREFSLLDCSTWSI